MALRNHQNLPQHTVDRIKKIAEELGYSPDPTLSALNKYRHTSKEMARGETLAFLTNWQSEYGWKELPAHDEFFRGALDHAKQLGFHLDHFWLQSYRGNGKRLSDVFASRGIRGIVMSSFFPNSMGLQGFDWDRFSSIKIDYFPKQFAMHSVTNDQQAIAQMAFQNVLDAGYERVGIILPEPWDEYVDRAWSTGFLAMQQNLPDKTKVPPLVYDYRIPGLKENALLPVPAEKMKGWMQSYQPDVILSYSLICLPTLEELGLQVGVDIGFADLFVIDTSGKTAGVIHECQQVGRLAIEFVVGKIQQNITGLAAYPSRTLVSGTWVDGDSLPIRR